MKRLGRVLCFMLCAMISVCGLMPAASALAEEPALTLLFTTDIHSNLVPHLALIDGKPSRVGGYARLKTAVDENTQKDKTLLLDSGDFSMGTLYQNFSLSDSLDLKLLDKLNYDAVALGNHDFEIGEDELRSELDEFRAGGGELSLLSSNLIYAGKNKIDDAQNGNPLSAQGVLNYMVLERGGLKIGLFSVMGYDAISYTPLKRLAYADPVKSAQSIVSALRRKENVDLVVMLSHAGTLPGVFAEDEDIAKQVKGIDVILGRHSHAALHEIRRVGDTMIVCAGTALNYLGKMEMYQKDGKWAADYSLIPLDGRWAENSEIAAMISPYTQKLNEGYLQSLGVTRGIMDDFAYSPYDFYDGDFMCSTLGDYPFGRLLSDSYFYALTREGIDDVQVAMIPVGTVRAGLYKGKLKVMDAYNVLSYGVSPTDGSSGAPIACVYLNGSELYDLCETSVSLSPFINSAQFLFSGLRYSYCVSRPIFDRVFKLEVFSKESGEYEPVERSDKQLYKVAVSWTSLQSIDLINDGAYGILKFRPKNSEGELLAVEDYPSCLVSRKDGGELKEWYALYSYIDSMPKNGDGLSVIDEKYSVPGGFVIKDPGSPSVFFENPSRAFWMMLGAAALLILLFILIILLICRIVKQKRRKKAQ